MDLKQHGTYVFSVRGAVPPDLTRRISELHARAILERLSRTSARPDALNSDISAVLPILGGGHHSSDVRSEDE